MNDSIADGFRMEIVFDGSAANTGELPLDLFAESIAGWNHVLQLSNRALMRADLSRALQASRSDLRLLPVGIRRGSLVLELVGYLAGGVATNALWDGMKLSGPHIVRFAKSVIRRIIETKKDAIDKDQAISAVEQVVQSFDITVPLDRDVSEVFVDSMVSGLGRIVAPLGSAAASTILRVPGAEIDIALDAADKLVISTPYPDPSVTPDDKIVEELVQFTRINVKTGTGIMRFVNPQHDSEVFSQQFFRSADSRIYEAGNPYTGSMHRKEPLRIRAQLRAYAPGRKGHYWLVLGLADDNAPLFQQEKRPSQSARRSPNR